jgi:mannose-6-phosphate isomerase-like protein (cupin superfamily)
MKYPTDLTKEYHTPEDCYIIELMNTPYHTDTSIARARVLPGVKTMPHYLIDTREYYYILAGCGRMYLGDSEPYEMGVGDTIFIEASQCQSIENNGDEDLIFLCVCSPRFEVHNYIAVKHQ